MSTPLSFDGRVAVVTGAGGGLGRAHALELARRGAFVVVNDNGGAVDGNGGSIDPAASVVAEILEAGGEAVASTASVTSSAGGEDIIATAFDAFGRVDIVVNNAGILRDRSFAKLSDDDIDAVIDVHLKGAFNVLRPAWRHFREQGYGRVVNTTSSSGLLGNFGQSNYAAAKMGLVGLTRVLAIEGSKYGIHVNALAPAALTRMTEGSLGDAVSGFGPELVCPVVAWLAHESCPSSGEVFSAAAGRIARFFVGLTPGWHDPELTAESLHDHFDLVRDATTFSEYSDISEELTAVRELLLATSR